MLNYNNNRNRNEQFDANELCIKKQKFILSVRMFYNIADIHCI